MIKVIPSFGMYFAPANFDIMLLNLRSLNTGCFTLAHQGMPRKFVNIIRSLYSQTSGRVRVYGELSRGFRTQSFVRQGCPLSPFPFKFVIDEILRRMLEGLQNSGVQIALKNTLEYADMILIFKEEEKAQVFLYALTKVILSLPA
ncbi:hypothetical protein T265_01026 [Opisthorchis viverrini]|uniref:Reverse transcriptase domain-containing protein n=1 Tax=Opisthorchis viverrini TaxID=6198 RepID=A0A075A3S1_OPIVI|nr:hypothetical protein T265_01026 [Opisthorchis viverrini]KER32932.1 hypothetical protein T265_01026 [Opisthorchis viverrini]